ncbi:DUF1338 domain-containing protein [Photobacterium leiognathi]|uniref:DUF1338 domain-containing protein n=1 Tax=Photobacterium leiognathi TaxID=553611 RepID=UPI002982A36E|nr:DUF1338 domain-containing protein [Photobacterium leiognathi]
MEQLFAELWKDYTQRLCPSASSVRQLLTEDEPLVNDHIALRTFGLPKCGMARLAAPFIAVGYKPKGRYHFKEKKLYAEHFEHSDPNAPKVFISELQLGLCSTELQTEVRKLVNQVDDGYFADPAFLYQGKPWQLSSEVYHLLNAESEYAGWVAAHGYGANHFTIDINQLEQFVEIAEVNHFLECSGFAINQAGGAVKGNPEVMLEQSATMADKVSVTFSDGDMQVPGGFYEFAKRYLQPDGEIYTGFVEASADKIFESTYNS